MILDNIFIKYTMSKLTCINKAWYVKSPSGKQNLFNSTQRSSLGVMDDLLNYTEIVLLHKTELHNGVWR